MNGETDPTSDSDQGKKQQNVKMNSSSGFQSVVPRLLDHFNEELPE